MTRVLIVEDSATQAEQLRIILEYQGHEVTVAENADRALAAFHAASFDLVISDIVMPGMSGYELCKKLKAEREKGNTPVILLTTLSDPMDIIQGLESGADNFITKPYEPEHLLDRVQNILEHRRLRREGKLKMGVEILFLNRTFLINSDRQQILDLLLATFEDVVRKNRDLVASQAALEAANKELEAFSYSVSHDLRGPLRAIDGFSQALHEEYADELDDKAREYLGRVRSSAKRMSELIDDLLLLSRVTLADITRQDVDLSALARAIADELHKCEQERSVEWTIEPGLTVSGDQKLLRVAMENLLGNAWKFTRQVKARIEVGAQRHGPETTFFVRDNGAGFDPRYAGRLFAPFQRLHSEAEFPGTGIGLATVQRIMRRHGGRVWAEAAIGRGAAFYFTVPTPK